MISDLGAGKLHVLASCNVVSEGTDVPIVGAAIMLRPTASLALAIQQMGRSLRTYPGKERAIILDHAGNTIRHGHPTDPMDWSLDGERKKRRGPKEKESSVQQCPGCYAVWPMQAKKCQNCGHEFHIKQEAPQDTGPKIAECVNENETLTSKKLVYSLQPIFPVLLTRLPSRVPPFRA